MGDPRDIHSPTRLGALALAVALATLALAPGCGTVDTAPAADESCSAEPTIRTTAAGVPFVRTPDACFAALADFPWEPKYVEIDGLRQAYVDEGPPDAAPVLLLHGEPSWSYLYRKMIPVLLAGGHRVIAMDHLGMGRSDKPTGIDSYSYLGHADRLARFIERLGLSDVTLFVQDWGSLVGLHVAGEHPEWFARIAVGDGALPLLPAGFQVIQPIADPDVPDPSLVLPFGDIPAQQVPFYDACGQPLDALPNEFAAWATYAMRGSSFRPSEVLEALTWFPLEPSAAAAYDAPFPRREYMAGVRTFPSLINQVGGTNDRAWAGLKAFPRPFVTIWASNDPGNLGRFGAQQNLIDEVRGAAGQPHTRLAEASHFLQDDQGAEIAALLDDWMKGTSAPADFPPRDCGRP